ALLLISAGCGGLTPYYQEGRPDLDTDPDSGTDTGTDSDSNTSSELQPLEITSVTPEHGTSAGGTTVEIQGTHFDGSTKVWFNDRTAEVIDSGSNWIEVSTPKGDQGNSSVRVTTDTHTGETQDAFVYWQDGAGQSGLMGSLSKYQYVGQYWESTPNDEANAYLYFNVPNTVEFWQFYSSGFGKCVSNYEYAGPSISVYEPGVSRVTLKRGSDTAVNLFQGSGETPTYIYESQGNIISYYKNGSTYKLESSRGADWPEFTLEGVVSTPDAFQVTSPAIDSFTAPTLTKNNLLISWTGAGADYVVIRLLRWGQDGTIIEEVNCVVNDTGRFQVPSNIWGGWSFDQQLTIQVGKAKVGGGTVPYNTANTGMIGVHWIIGAGWTN
ncbi:MAG: hypothetical protein ACI9MC_003768, partial [Kiritimatiellia bacterium]